MGDGLVVVMFMIEFFAFSSLLYFLRGSGAGAFSQLHAQKRGMVRRLSLFLVIPPLCWSWALADRLMGYYNGEHVYWVQILHSTFATSQGVLNALAYGWDAELRILWADWIGGAVTSPGPSGPETVRLLGSVHYAGMPGGAGGGANIQHYGSTLAPDLEHSRPINVDVKRMYEESESDAYV
eukprot:TRINITY_DN5869_c0_g1_i6.p1 TRINITY_DN5869_c0_g1~~TRINITY_DN5869_c0_g1_i6.p1  ORF type:complete len:181 (-),score=30.16 TRINITY_DN5869_c0_g1_i6:139-681(-)